MLCPVCEESKSAKKWSTMQWKAKTPHLTDPLGWQRNCCRDCSDCKGHYFNSYYHAASHTELSEQSNLCSQHTCRELHLPHPRLKTQSKWRCGLCKKKLRHWTHAEKCDGVRPAVGYPDVLVRCGLRCCSPLCYTDAMETFEGQKCAGCYRTVYMC
jgi:hypothetical protein